LGKENISEKHLLLSPPWHQDGTQPHHLLDTESAVPDQDPLFEEESAVLDQDPLFEEESAVLDQDPLFEEESAVPDQDPLFEEESAVLSADVIPIPLHVVDHLHEEGSFVQGHQEDQDQDPLELLEDIDIEDQDHDQEKKVGLMLLCLQNFIHGKEVLLQ